MLKVSLIGATGYAGEELLKILLLHNEVEITYIAAKVDGPKAISEIFQALKGRLDLVCDNFDPDKASSSADLFFLALPHRVSMSMAPALIKAGKKVIDLSADYRLKDPGVYKKFYGVEHTDSPNLKSSVYGLPELYRKVIKGAQLIANPGCYPTSVILGLSPLLKAGCIEDHGIIVDSKSGVSGAGRCPSPSLHFPEVNESFKAYKIGVHQHAPEMEQELSAASGRDAKIIFVPHLLPINRGILSTMYVRLKKAMSTKDILGVLKGSYGNEPFVRVLDEGVYPEIKYVANTNYCDIGAAAVDGGEAAVIVSSIDNLVKGASGQAVQNMNIMNGFDEKEGLC
ncbi:MAG: N-acetyl-gamma-glutamyl-phosphate reductase [Candidatus Omnitrophica bacterium CG1_02_49_10]|nr:MAG: N-acetyl-gamma-glutamyl-phosphate reductase [Candidatus Omnitrophica bacterium CG1_02_49_10]